MAIAYDTNTAPARTIGTSHTFSHTCSGSDRLLVVMGQDTSGGTSTVTGVTYNGVAMTKIAGAQVPSDRQITMWYLVAPATGTNDVVVTSSTSQNLRFHSISYTGVDQTTPTDGSNTNTSSGTSISTTITTTVDNCWMVMFAKDNSGGKTYTTSTGDTIRENTDAAGHVSADTGGAITPAGSNTMTLDAGVSVNKGAIGMAISPATGGGGGGGETENSLNFGGGIL